MQLKALINKEKISILILSLLLLVISFLLANKVFQPKTTLEVSKSNHISNILILGTDEVIPKYIKDWFGRSDVIVVLSINKKTNSVSIISIPRDTKVAVRKGSIDKINAANVYGGYKLAKKAVEKLLNIQIDHVAMFSITGFKELLKVIGKIKIYVPQDMSYHDSTGNLHIELKAGLQEMDADNVVKFLRFRADGRGDIGRIERQHIFFKAALRKLTESQTIFKLPSILNKANEVFLTDMNFREMFSLGLFFKSLPKMSFKSYMVPGNVGNYGYWIVDQSKLAKMLKSIFNE